MKKNKPIIFIVIILALAATVAVLSFKYLNIENQEVGLPSGSPTSPVGKKVYQNAVYGFSFEYPEDFRITEIPEDLGTTILVEKPGTRESFQIFISEFDEPGPITAERVRQDLPDLPMENPQQVILGSRTSDGSPTSGGITALIFFGEDAALGKTREVWFIWPDDPRVAGNYLYQVTTYPDLDGLVGPVMDSLTFK